MGTLRGVWAGIEAISNGLDKLGTEVKTILPGVVIPTAMVERTLTASCARIITSLFSPFSLISQLPALKVPVKGSLC